MAKMIICSLCGREMRHRAKGLCGTCYMAQSRVMGTCLRCRKERPLDTKGLCNACHVMEYKKKYNYKGPIRVCISCKEEKPIHAQDRCSACYHIWYREQNLEQIREKDKQRRKDNPEKFTKWNRNYYRANQDKELARSKKYWRDNKEKLAQRDKEKYAKERKASIESSIDAYHTLNIDEELVYYKRQVAELKAMIPDFKRIWVNEFLETVYRKRNSKTIIKFLRDILRLINYLKEIEREKYFGGWNTIEITDIEDCQVHTGILKDSLRIFFNWLLSRKKITNNVADAIPTHPSNLRASKVPGSLIKKLYNKWNYADCNLEERIAGLLIMYYGLTNDELRRLKNKDFLNNMMNIRNQSISLDGKLSIWISEYQKFKAGRFFGVNTTYFFVTAYSIPKDKPVSIGHFSKLFQSRRVGSTPSELRKAMIFFHKNDNDPFHLAFLFGISPRGAARYFEKLR